MAGPQNVKLTALWMTDPKEAASEVKLALAAEGQDLNATAKRLNISRRSLYRYLTRMRELGVYP